MSFFIEVRDRCFNSYKCFSLTSGRDKRGRLFKVDNSGDQEAILAVLFTVIPILVVALLLRWVRIIRVNSEIQVEQNKEIITLLKELSRANEGK